MRRYTGSEFAWVPDSVDARRFIELASYGADLEDAASALAWAVRSRDLKEPTADVWTIFIGYAVVAYCRATSRSDARASLLAHVAVPPEFTGLHDTIWKFRNKSIAHSQSDLVTTYAAVHFADINKQRAAVIALTEARTLPWSLVDDFRRLLDEMEGAVDELIAPVRERLTTEALERRAAGTALDIEGPANVDLRATDFAANTKRTEYPTQRVNYWDALATTTQPRAWLRSIQSPRRRRSSGHRHSSRVDYTLDRRPLVRRWILDPFTRRRR